MEQSIYTSPVCGNKPVPSCYHRVPSPHKPNKRLRGQGDTFKAQSDSAPRVSESQRAPPLPPSCRPPSLESSKSSVNDQDFSRPRTLQLPYPKAESKFSSSSDTAGSSPSRGDLPQGLKRSKSGNPTPKALVPINLIAQPWSNKPPASVALSDSIFNSKLSSLSGALGD